MKLTFFLSIAVVSLACTSARAAILATWPIEHAVELADLVVVAERGTQVHKEGYVEVRVREVLFGTAAKPKDTLFVSYLGGLETSVQPYGSFKNADAKALDLKDRPLILCLSRKAVYDRKLPGNFFELQTCGVGTAVKILDHHNVYGYYQWMNPGPYRLQIEVNSTRELRERIARAVVLSADWAKIVKIRDVCKRQTAIVEFLMDPALPGHFSYQACAALRNSRIVAVVKDEVKRAPLGPAPKKKKEMSKEEENEAFLEVFRELTTRVHHPAGHDRSRLNSALSWVEDDGQELRPLLKEIKARIPSYAEAVDGCVARLDERIKIMDAFIKDLKEHGCDTHNVTQTVVCRWPDAWKDIAEKLHRERGREPHVKKYLDDTWKSEHSNRNLTLDDLPARYTEQHQATIQRLGHEDAIEQDKAMRQLKDALYDAYREGPIVRRLLERALEDSQDREIRIRAKVLLKTR